MPSAAPWSQLAPTLTPDTAAWLRARGAASVRVGADGVVEFSAREMGAALADAVRDLLPQGRAMPVVCS